MICTSIQNRKYEEILDILDNPEIEMAEIRLDRCELTDGQTADLFSQTDTPLVATCRIAEVGSTGEAERRLKIAIESGARFADLEIEAPVQTSKFFRSLCARNGTEIIRSYHNFEETPKEEVLYMSLARCFRYGADIAKIVTTCTSEEDAARIESLYSVVLEDVPSLQGRLIAFGMGKEGRQTRVECLKRGAPFTYAALTEDDAAAPGQWAESEMRAEIYKDVKSYHAYQLMMPASKSFAQRAIFAAALADGTSHLDGYSPCGDSEAAIKLAEAIGASVESGTSLTIKGIGAGCGSIGVDSVNTGESGLLTRLAIPVLAAIDKEPFTVNGEGTLLKRPLNSAADIMASFGVLLSNSRSEGAPGAVTKSRGTEMTGTDAESPESSRQESRELFVPVKSRGQLIPGTADIPGKDGSQLISGLLMALPLCEKDSEVHVSDPKSIPYMYVTLDVLRHFGIQTRSEMEGDADMLEAEDWSCCSGINFKIRGGQKYRAADIKIEGDWSAAANFLVAGAVFGSAEIKNIDAKSLQADITIVDILVEAGAVVSQLEDNSFCVRKAPLEAIDQDLNNSPDLFPIAAVLAAFCAGESRLAGIGRLASKESNRAEAILQMLIQMGVEARIDGDSLYVCGETLTSRILNGRLLNGGEYTSRHDHRMVMALKVASMAAKSPIVIDDEACVGKSFPGFSLD